jgi:hypothetical protein
MVISVTSIRMGKLRRELFSETLTQISLGDSWKYLGSNWRVGRGDVLMQWTGTEPEAYYFSLLL